MSTKIFKVLGILTAVSILALSLMAFSWPGGTSPVEVAGRGGPGGRGGQGGGTAVGTTAATLSAAEQKALIEAIQEEYGAYNLYQSVIAKFGNVAPFAQIVRAEQQHINALTRQANLYGVAVPANPGLTTTPVFATLSEAYAAGAAAEIADAALYDQLKLTVSNPGLLQVFNNLQSASLNSHLPAFQAYQ